VTQFSDWTPTNLQPHTETVEVYSNCDSVELFLNDKSLGAQEKPDNDSPRMWKVEFEPGTIKAVASNGGKIAATQIYKTAAKASKIRLNALRNTLTPSWDDVIRVEAAVVDEQGVLVPTATNQIAFSVTGPGVIAAVDNASVLSHEPFGADTHSAYQGRCYVWIKASDAKGQITLTARSEQLESEALTLTVSQ